MKRSEEEGCRKESEGKRKKEKSSPVPRRFSFCCCSKLPSNVGRLGGRANWD